MCNDSLNFWEIWSNERILKLTVDQLTIQLPNPLPSVSDTILNNTEIPCGQLPKDDRLFFQYLSLVERPQSPEWYVTDFTAHVLCTF